MNKNALPAIIIIGIVGVVATLNRAKKLEDERGFGTRAMIDEISLDSSVMNCPSVDPAVSQTPPYIWIRGADCADAVNVIAYEPIQNHGGEGGNVLFCDGHVEFVLEANWEQTLRDGGVNLP